MSASRLLVTIVLAGLCAACGGRGQETLPAVSRLRSDEVRPPPLTGPVLDKRTVPYEELAGWGNADYVAALVAFSQSCLAYTPDDQRKDEYLSIPHARWASACRKAHERLDFGLGQDEARVFFEEVFEPQRLSAGGEALGTVTAYYEPIIEARSVQIGPFDEPILGRPADLVTRPNPNGGEMQVFQQLPDGQLRVYPDRAQIVASASSNILGLGPAIGRAVSSNPRFRTIAVPRWSDRARGL